jgi:hypothetical protein
MNPALSSNTTPTISTGRGRLDDELAEDLARAVSLVEDWLLHASDETLDELAGFAYGSAHRGHDRLRWIIELLGEAAARLRPTPPPAEPEPTNSQPGPSR